MAQPSTQNSKSNKEEVFINRLASAYQIKTKPGIEKLKKYILDNNDYKEAMEAFIRDQSFVEAVYTQPTGADQVAIYSDSPTPDKIKKKGFIILRITENPLTEENINHDIVFIEMTKNVLDHLYLLTNDILGPVMQNPDNQQGWTDLVTKDLMDRFNAYVAQVYIMIGLNKGRTMLPLPNKKLINSEGSEKDKAHIFEGSIITWTKQIKNVLKLEPEQAFKAADHPGPKKELEFWENKAANLNSIFEQLQSVEVKTILRFLERSKSTYTNPFTKLQKEVQEAKVEANDNFRFLSTLKELFDQLSDTGGEFPTIHELFPPIIHTILLIYKNSRFYNTAPRLVVLIKQICNEIINRAKGYIDGAEITSAIGAGNDEVIEISKKLEITIDICSKFKDEYIEYKAKTGGSWKVTHNALFSRLDAYAERCHEILQLTTTILQFNKLEKIELGGTKGKVLTETIKQIFDEFKKAVDNFKKLTSDAMDISLKNFDEDFLAFKNKIKELERRLASVITQGFDDNDTISGKYKLLDCFEGILNRPIIQDELEKKHAILLDMYKQDLKVVQAVFLQGKTLIDRNDERSPIFSNYPPIAGTLTWCKGLKDRVVEPFDKLATLGQGITEREEYKDIQKLHTNILKTIEDYEASKKLLWEKEVEESSQEKLKQPLLCKDENGLLKVNFDPALVRLLREVKYFKLLNLTVPDTAETIFQKVSVYRYQTVNLDLIVQNYNKIITCLNEVEEPLVKKRIQAMDKEVEPGITTYQWKSPEINDFIKKTKETVDSLYEIVDKMKKSLESITNELLKFKKPMIQRKNKPISPEEYDNILRAIIANKLGLVKECSGVVHKLLKEVNDSVKIDRKLPEWKNYTEYINTIVIDGIVSAIVFALEHLNEQINSRKADQAPLFQIKMELEKKGVVFEPEIEEQGTLESKGSKSVRDTIRGWINEIFAITHHFPRLDTAGASSSGGNNGDYLMEIKDNFNVKHTMSQITDNLDMIEGETKGLKNDFITKYNYLWEQDPNEFFEKFLNEFAPKDDDRDGEEVGRKPSILLKDCREKIPNMELFDKKITELKQIQVDISKTLTPVEKHWLKIDIKGLIKSLQYKVNIWIKVYTDFLIKQFVTTSKNLIDFTKRTIDGLKVNPKDVMNSEEDHEKLRNQEKNRKLLMNVMKHISEAKEVKSTIDQTIERMKGIVTKLKKHTIPISTDKNAEDPLQIIQTSFAAFNETDKKVNEIKKDILNLISDEAIQIKIKLDKFTKEVENFKQDYKANLPYFYDDSISIEEIKGKYRIIDEYYSQLQGFEDTAKQNAELENLFELEPRQYKPLKECLSDLKNLKTLWDNISLVNLQYNDWKGKLWRQIKADTMLQQNKFFQVQTKALSKEVKAIKGFQVLSDKIQNMQVVLTLVESLRGEYMEDRHWKQLKDKTKSDFDQKSSNFVFEGILKIQLYKYKADVEEIADVAMKEAKIDKKLKNIENNWSKMMFEFEPYKEERFIFAPLDNMIEVLDADQLELMGMKAQGKYVEFFIKVVEDWREKLGRVDAVVNEWLKVQKNWRILVNIFKDSEDIRMQLPQDTKTFEGVDQEFEEMMAAAHESPLIIDNCTDARKQSLLEMTLKIKKCEKALNDYLEQKKKVFPRFYFLSNQSLLTILSNGQNPPKVCEFIGDCFDGLKTLRFEKPENSLEISKVANAMYSKDDEIIPFQTNFVAEGQVEIWLKQLQHKMREVLYDILADAKTTSESWETDAQKPREEWIRDYPSQIALLTTQIIWTEDVNRAFEELSSGMQGAMKECEFTIRTRITKLINKVTKPLEVLERMKIINIITIDVHSRDVVQNLVLMKISEVESFTWQSQLKFEWSLDKNNDVTSKQYCRFDWERDPNKYKCIIKIVDWFRFYSYEYVGNTLRLVITPLTDRCYITLTQALNLVMGGAPAGPAGTGKTETTKDLGRAVGLPVIVFNCSDQMNKDSMAQIFMGLCQSGAWGCFDEFNRISIEVLSVISTQVKTALDALKEKKRKFVFMEEGEIALEDTCGFFITMNPGYAGRTELPDNLKALFRSCAMVVPDLVLICENMLMSEGFNLARELSKKFVSLYMLSRELLSKQRHYDWGLRAVKSVLRQAGKLKREPSNADIHEDPLLMRALRDFNIPKIVTDDKPIFLRLIQDLFPNAVPPPKEASTLTKLCENTTKGEMGLYYEEAFVKKCIDLSEILEVRHCCFIIGPPGCGKTTVWKTLLRTHFANKEEGEYDTLNPKAVTSDELFGSYTKSKEWKNGVLSVIMKNQNKCEEKYKQVHKHKWSILDGDIDPEWIESLNTVMDDNKVLTLVSNDRIPLTPSMRLLFEVSNLKNATPATVSRGGVLFINETDIGWLPFVNSWLERSQPYMKTEEGALEPNYPPLNETAKSVFIRCFQSYIDTPSDLYDSVKLTYLCPHSTMGSVQSICTILDGLLTEHQNYILTNWAGKEPDDQLKQIYEAFFIFATMWAWGGSIGGGQDDNEILSKFSSVWRSLSKIKFPEASTPTTCYDYYWSIEDSKWVHWSSRIEPYVYSDEPIFSKIFVSTIHTTRLRYLLNIHLKRKKPVMFVGGTGTGKTQVIKDYLASTKPEQVSHKTINFSSFTDAKSLQKSIESMLDKKSGKTYGSAMNKILIAFIDDLNMPYVDKYGTQSPIQLMRQIIDYGSIFNREQLEERKFIQDLLFFASQNHKSGSFTVDLRLQRNFSVFTMYTPTDEIIKTIFGNILGSHLNGPGFEDKVKNSSEKIIDATIDFFKKVIKSPQFSPSAKKFHYQFNFRELAKIVEGVMRSTPTHYKNVFQIGRLWLHEVRRVFEDRFINNEDTALFRNFLKEGINKVFGDENSKENPLEEPLIFTSFISDGYLPVTDMMELRRILKEKMAEYNDVKAQMNLVLFDQAIEHVCKICRIIILPAGHALLVGVGGSGKQSLARLATFIIGYELEQMVVTQSFGVNELRNFLSEMYRKIAKPNSSTRVFMINDSQIKQETFLIPINDMLNSGWVSDLFTKEDFEAMVSNLRNEAKGNGIPDNPESLLNFFYDKMKKNLKIILCFSPVGEIMRVRARKFPGIINSTSIDWFHPWPKDALVDVANKFLMETLESDEELRMKIALNMAETHLSIDVANIKFRKLERRNNYTTPKSFLELISFYNTLLSQKRGQIDSQIGRYQTGLGILAETKTQVEKLQSELKLKMVDVEKQREETNKLIEKVQAESEIAGAQQQKANEEQQRTNIQKMDAEKLASDCKIALAEAEPALESAKAAVNCLGKPSITEMKNLNNPPAGVMVTARVVLTLFGDKIGPNDAEVWKKCQQAMNQPERFLDRVKAFKGEEIDQNILDTVNKIIQDPSKKYNETDMKGQSYAASKLCAWSTNIVTFNKIFKEVRPLQIAKDKANEDLDVALKSLHKVKEQVRKLNEMVDGLKKQLAEAEEQKRLVEDDANKCQSKLTAAEKLVNGLSGENKRWGESVVDLQTNIKSVIGDALLASEFVSYIGAFSAKIRLGLWKDIWIPDIISKQIPMTEGIEPLKILTTEAVKAKWRNEGLPADTMSLENAAIISSCSRWPLLIDPQLQGSNWIRGSQGERLSSINIGQKQWMRELTNCISQGKAVLLEGIQEEIDATLEPLLARAIVKKGVSYYLEMGSDVIDYDINFKLFLMTKLSNPHFRPEIAAQCTIINFIVTESGLEEQLLAMVVNVEKNELEVQKQELVKMQNEFQVELDRLESELLKELSEANAETILENRELIEKLDHTKKTAISIQEQSEMAKKTEVNINAQREIYRTVAAEGAMLYFLLISLCVIDHMYQYSLESFIRFFFKAIDKTQETDETRIEKLRESIRYTIYQWVSRGLFEKHKLIFLTLITFRLMNKKQIEVNYAPEEMDFLIKAIPKPGVENNLDWLPNNAWDLVQGLIHLEEFRSFAQNMEKDAPNRFKDWYNELTPEQIKLPLDWKKLDSMPFKKLLVIRCLRPDRITVALTRFIRDTLPKGDEFVDMDSKSSFVDILSSAIQDSEPQTPIFFILSPGADPVKEVEKIIKRDKDKYRIESGKSFFNISLGQGQDEVAKRRIEEGNKEGHWVMLQNIHLMPRWLIELEKILDSFSGDTGGSHPNFRLFLSAEPSTGVPIGILDRSIKLTNEPPSGLKANMKRAFMYFPKQDIEDKDSKVKSIYFGVCFFHSTVIERKRFGPMGWNMSYPFNVGDLRDSYLVLNRYMESNSGSSKIPFQDLIYIFGQIMYGGHIVDDWDRRLARAYLENIMTPQIFEEAELFPYVDGKNISFKVPAPTTYDKYIEHIETLGQQTPIAYGLHPNAEIGFRTTQCYTLFNTLLELAPRDSGSSEAGGKTTQDTLELLIKRYIDDIGFKNLIFNVDEIKNKIDADQKGPYQNVFIQEIEYMTILLTEMHRSCEEIDLGIKGLLTISEQMEQTMDSLVLNRVPPSWANLAYPSKRGLESWIVNLLKRVEQLNAFKDDPLTLPKVIMVSRFFNPQSYLTAIKQVVASNHKGLELNKLYIQTDVTKKTIEEIDGFAKDGSYVFGFVLEGARWDVQLGQLDESKPKEMFSVIPVVYCKALPLPPEGKEDKTVYQCPAYKTEDRSSTYVFTAQLKTRVPPRKWILAGVAIIMDVEGVSDESAIKKEGKDKK